MRNIRLVYTILLCLLCSFAFAKEQQTSTEEPGNLCSTDYCMGPDDVLKVTVYREEELDRSVRVSADGSFSFPLIGKVIAIGKTVPQLEEIVTKQLRKYLVNPQVTIFVEEFAKITVTGQVEKPGSYPIKGQLTVVEAIGLAGGFTKIAAKNKVKILRLKDGEKETIIVNVADIERRGDKSKDVLLEHGDVVIVPESLF